MTTFSQLNDLQRKSLVDLFAHIKHFNQKFTAAALDNNSTTSFLENMRSTSTSLFTHFIYQSNVTVDKRIFKTLRQENEGWDEEVRRFKRFVELLNRGNKQLMNKYYRYIYEPSDSGNELSSEHSGMRREVREGNVEGNAWERESETRESETKEIYNNKVNDEKPKKKSTQNNQRKSDKKYHSANKEKDEILKEKSKLVKEKDDALKKKDELTKMKDELTKMKDDLVKEKERLKKNSGNSKEKGVIYSSDKNGFANKKNKHHLAAFLKKEDTETDDSIERRFDIHKKKVRTPRLLVDESEGEEMTDLVKFGYVSKAEYVMKRFEEINRKVKKNKDEEDVKVTSIKKNKKRNQIATSNNWYWTDNVLVTVQAYVALLSIILSLIVCFVGLVIITS